LDILEIFRSFRNFGKISEVVGISGVFRNNLGIVEFKIKSINFQEFQEFLGFFFLRNL
jgi:hypothetical protein